jgi:tRNA pseudouridine55 synthase
MRSNASSGVLILDKPAQITSAGVVRRIKRLPGIRKAGHAGTLDPSATGVLLCPVNQATRLSRFLLGKWKTYEAVMVLGIETDTQDAEGAVLRRCELPHLDRAAIQAAVTRFEGEIEQIPPAYSALKHRGKPLYEYARSGRTVRKPARKVAIDRIVLDFVDLPEIGLTVRCASGTYIRSLCADIGGALGCGGHLRRLRRRECGGFVIDEASSLEACEEMAARGRLSELITPMARALRGMPAHVADKALTERIKYGKIIHSQQIGRMADTGYIKILDPDENLLAVLYRGAEHPDRLEYACVFHHAGE